MTKNPNSISSIETNADFKKSNKFIENTKRAVRKALTTTGIVAGSMWPISTPSVVPASANIITRLEPTTSADLETAGEGTTADLFAAFNEKSNTPENNFTSPATESQQFEAATTRGESGTTSENNNSTINSLEHKTIEINNINPVDILPIIGQIEAGDKNVYNHIEHLRVAEATRIRDMMREYGAGNYSAEEYQNLMMRLNTGMLGEVPLGYNNYGTIGVDIGDEGSEHAHIEWSILNSLLNHTNLKVAFYSNRRKNIETFIEENDNAILIFGCSAYPQEDKSIFDTRPENDKVRELCKSGKLIIFKSGGNIYEESGILKNKSYQKDVDGDEHGIYSLQANANGKNDSNASIALFATVGTNKDGDINQTNEIYASSMFPIGFHDKVLFSGRAFPFHSLDSGKIEAEGNVNNGKYATSYTNYVNVAIADLCFQMKADVADVNELLEMIRSTALTDYIRLDLNGDGDTDDIHEGQPESQPLQLMNPAGFFQKYLMPTSIPTNLKSDETTPLEKGYYHGIVYQIPGAEVNINGQWIPFTDDNKDIILSQNPMNLKWRLNGESLKGYTSNIINGQIIAVDDQWNGLNIAKDFSFTIDNSNAIDTTEIDTPSDNTWYTLNGIRLDSKPTKPGVYIVNGKKVILK